jgi:hypothetical protein
MITVTISAHLRIADLLRHLLMKYSSRQCSQGATRAFGESKILGGGLADELKVARPCN